MKFTRLVKFMIVKPLRISTSVSLKVIRWPSLKHILLGNSSEVINHQLQHLNNIQT